MSVLRDKLLEKEREREEREPEARFWKPQPGEILEGVVKTFGKMSTAYGEQEFLKLEDEAGLKHIVFLNPVLQQLLDEEGVRPDDTIAIKYLGLKLGKDQMKKYKDYILVKAQVDVEG